MQLDPASALGEQFIGEAQNAAKHAFGENSVAYTAVAHINTEVSNVLDNPVKAAASRKARVNVGSSKGYKSATTCFIHSVNAETRV